jgi:tetratricopeptide (TPR) repeat protein
MSTYEELVVNGYRMLHEQDVDQALDISRDLQQLDALATEGYVLEGEVMQKLNQFDHCVRLFSKALEIDPEAARVYNLRGYALMQKELIAEAVGDFERAIELEDLPEAHRNLVLCRVLEEKGAEAIDYLIGRIRKDPRDVENWILMGDIMKRGGQTDKARSYYEQALKMDPENEYAQRQLEE